MPDKDGSFAADDKKNLDILDEQEDHDAKSSKSKQD
jgi:hypothetical protein